MIQIVIVQVANVIRIHCRRRIGNMCPERTHHCIKRHGLESRHRALIQNPAMAVIHLHHAHHDAELKYEIIR